MPFGDPKIEAAARDLACAVAEKINLTGLLAVEMFLRRDGSLLINELAPRPHNSGHWTFDACVTSQFEQQLRAVCGLPLGATDILRPAAMANLLGDLWANGEPNWTAALAMPDVKLHLYGKAEARPGRKMGHLVAFGSDAAEAKARAIEARAKTSASRECCTACPHRAARSFRHALSSLPNGVNNHLPRPRYSKDLPEGWCTINMWESSNGCPLESEMAVAGTHL